MKNWITFAIIISLAACQNQPENIRVNDSVDVSKHMPDTTSQMVDSVKTVDLHNGTQCFLYTNNKDTISMRLVLKDSAASGDLIYNFYEKDKNEGTFQGFLKNDTLLANYTFSSEGMRSVRQIVFLLKGNILLSGSGSMKEQKGRLVFSNKKDIVFDGTMLLQPVDCGALPFR